MEQLHFHGVSTPKDYTIELVSVTLEGGDYKVIDENIETRLQSFKASGEETENPNEPDKPNKPDDSKDITSSKYTISNGYISKIAPGSTIKTFKSNITGSESITIKDKNGNNVSDTVNCATGMTLISGKNTYTLVVMGDIDGNGKISANDLAKLRLHYIGKEPLDGAYKEASDVDGNGRTSLNDIAKIKLIIIGKESID